MTPSMGQVDPSLAIYIWPFASAEESIEGGRLPAPGRVRRPIEGSLGQRVPDAYFTEPVWHPGKDALQHLADLGSASIDIRRPRAVWRPMHIGHRDLGVEEYLPYLGRLLDPSALVVIVCVEHDVAPDVALELIEDGAPWSSSDMADTCVDLHVHVTAALAAGLPWVRLTRSLPWKVSELTAAELAENGLTEKCLLMWLWGWAFHWLFRSYRERAREEDFDTYVDRLRGVHMPMFRQPVSDLVLSVLPSPVWETPDYSRDTHDTQFNPQEGPPLLRLALQIEYNQGDLVAADTIRTATSKSEAQMLYDLLGKVKGLPPQSLLRQCALRYARIRNLVHQHFCYLEPDRGLKGFVERFRRLDLLEPGAGTTQFEDDERDRNVYDALASTCKSGRLTLLEGRISPPWADGTDSWVREKIAPILRAADRLRRESGIEIGLVVHHIKRDSDGAEGFLRYEALISDYNKEAETVVRAFSAIPRAHGLILGVDVAGDERLLPSWVFSQPMQRYEGLDIGMTFHAGEDVCTPIDGMRRIWEFVELLARCKQRNLDKIRIGHGVALSWHPPQHAWIVPKEIILDDLCWLYQLLQSSCEPKLTVPGPGFAAAVTERLKNVAADVIDESEGNLREMGRDPLTLARAYERKFCPAFQKALQNQEVRARSKWDDVESSAKAMITSRTGWGRVGVTAYPTDIRAVVEPLQIYMKEYLSNLGVAVECCPSSNHAILGTPFAGHPVISLMDSNVDVAVCSDDPLLFCCSALGDLRLLLTSNRKPRAWVRGMVNAARYLSFGRGLEWPQDIEADILRLSHSV